MNIKDKLKIIMLKFQEMQSFFLILVMFLPDYMRYPLFLVLLVQTSIQLISKKDFSIKFIIPFIGLSTLNAFLNRNYFGIGISILFLGLIPYLAAIKRNFANEDFDSLQYYIVWGFLFNFPFVYTNYAPQWFKTIESSIMESINIEGMPSWKLPKYGEGYFRAYSTFDNPNFYAFVLLIVFVICFNQIQSSLKSKDYKVTLFYLAALFINCYVMLLTGTRSVLVASAAAVFVLILVQQEWQMLKFIVMLGCLGLSYIILNPTILPRLLDISSHMGIRTEIWANALDVIVENPWFGKGFMTYAHLFDTTHAHNIYIEMLLSLGIVGTLMVVFYAIYVGIYYLNNSSFDYFPFAVALFIGLMVFGVLDFPFYYLQTTYLFCAAMLVPTISRKKDI